MDSISIQQILLSTYDVLDRVLGAWGVSVNKDHFFHGARILARKKTEDGQDK